MYRGLLFVFVCFFAVTAFGQHQPVIAIHGGAGTILKKNMSPEKERAYRQIMARALTHGYEVLQAGGSALEAVTQTIVIMEDSPLFNAGKGSVFTHEGVNEMDASIMDGRDLNAGAVAGVRHVKNPILLAEQVMVASPHVLLSGTAAEVFAKQQNVTLVDAKFFFTQRRWDALQKAKAREAEKKPMTPADKHGTVGVVALDSKGNLAAGTSTGGMTNKRYGRIGDSPIIGAGTYADNQTCAVSATGHGEYFIRATVARDIAAYMELAGLDLQAAADRAIQTKLTKLGGTGGVVSVDKQGKVAFSFNTSGMYRGMMAAAKQPQVAIYQEPLTLETWDGEQ
jgi:beta-aspartyl-peptidase (threonine type)